MTPDHTLYLGTRRLGGDDVSTDAEDDDNESAGMGMPAFHGYAPSPSGPSPFVPPLTIAVSREAGARGRTIARAAAQMLGWTFLTQETLEYMSHAAQTEMESVPDSRQGRWIDERIAELTSEGKMDASPPALSFARVVLEVAAQGHCVILGRGAGCILPASCKLHVRVVAPQRDRIAYLMQLERLSWADAESAVRERDRSREQFVTRQFGRNPNDILQYDLVLNSAVLGADACAGVIVHAARAKESVLARGEGPADARVLEGA